MHALRAGRGAHCPSVFVCVAHLSLEMTALFIYLYGPGPTARRGTCRRCSPRHIAPSIRRARRLLLLLRRPRSPSTARFGVSSALAATQQTPAPTTSSQPASETPACWSARAAAHSASELPSPLPTRCVRDAMRPGRLPQTRTPATLAPGQSPDPPQSLCHHPQIIV